MSQVQDVARRLSAQHQRVEVFSVGCFGFGFDTTASVDVDVEPVSERVLRFRLNTSRPSPAPHVQTLGKWSLHSPPLRDVDLPSESEGRAYTCYFVVIVWSGDQCHSAP